MARINLSKFPPAVQKAAHAIGMDSRDPYIRHGKKFYKPYRNYYGISENCDGFDIWMQLQAEGKARRVNGRASFYLTRKGLDWLGDQLGMYIHNEDE